MVFQIVFTSLAPLTAAPGQELRIARLDAMVPITNLSLGTLPAVYRLSPPQPVDKVVASLLRELEQPGFLALLDVPSKLLWRLERALPASVDWALRWANRK